MGIGLGGICVIEAVRCEGVGGKRNPVHEIGWGLDDEALGRGACHGETEAAVGEPQGIGQGKLIDAHTDGPRVGGAEQVCRVGAHQRRGIGDHRADCLSSITHWCWQQLEGGVGGAADRHAVGVPLDL